MAEEVLALNLERRFPWMNAYGGPDLAKTQAMLDVLAESVERDDVDWYRGYATKIQVELLASGMPAIAMFALADLMYGVVLELLTPDQQELVLPLLHKQRRQQQDIA
jgi:hypothetical protein